jgi:hypothetical protein
VFFEELKERIDSFEKRLGRRVKSKPKFYSKILILVLLVV